MRLLLFILVTGGVFCQYQPNWDSLDTRPNPSWYDQVKFGIFIHWGVYSVPAYAPVGTYAEWYWNDLITQPNGDTAAFHNRTYGADFTYQEFAQRFTAELFDAKQWLDLIYASGARYIVPTSKHHEGFCLWPSAQSWNWNSVDLPPHRDLIGELMTEASTRPDMHPGFYYSLYEWFNPIYNGPNPQDYVQQVMLPQLYDLVNTYKPHILWTDGEWMQSSDFWNSPQFLAWLFNESPVKDIVVVNDRWGNDTRDVHGGFFTPEYSSDVFLTHKWEENSGMDVHSYGYNRHTPASSYWSAQYLVNLLVRSVAFGGNFLLDIGPNWDGTIPTIMQERLTQIGSWMDVNSDAIYGTSVWRVQQEYYIQPRWEKTLSNSNNVYGLVSPFQNSSDGSVVFLAKSANLSQCQSVCMSSSTCISYTWFDANNGDYSYLCYGVVTNLWNPTPADNVYSGFKYSTLISYTTKNNAVYALVSRWHSPSTPLLLPSPTASAQTSVFLLGYDGAIAFQFSAGANGITLNFPDLEPADIPCDYNWVFKLTSIS